MTARPSSGQVPRFASGGGAAVTEPSSGKKDTGWVVGELPPAQYFNWLFLRIYQFVQWLYDQVVTTDEVQTITGAKTHTMGSSNTTAITATGHGTGSGLIGIGGAGGSGVKGYGGTDGAGNAGAGLYGEGTADRAPLSIKPQAAPSGGEDANGDVYVSTADNTTKAHINGAWKALVHSPKVQSDGSFREDVHLVGSGGGEPAFGTNMTNFGPEAVGPVPTMPVGFWKDAFGVVHLEGRAKCNNAAGAVEVFVLPVGYRPAGVIRVPVWKEASGESIVSLGIYPDGVSAAGSVAITLHNSGDSVELTGISFRAA